MMAHPPCFIPHSLESCHEPQEATLPKTLYALPRAGLTETGIQKVNFLTSGWEYFCCVICGPVVSKDQAGSKQVHISALLPPLPILLPLLTFSSEHSLSKSYVSEFLSWTLLLGKTNRILTGEGSN